MYIDPHCHLNIEPLDQEFDDILKESKKQGIKYIINVGVDKLTSVLAVEQAKKSDMIYASVGYHPSEAKKYNREILEELIVDKNVIAIGEIGLDYYWDSSFKEIQKKVFIDQIELAIKHDLPVIIHSRNAKEDTFDILKNYKDSLKGIFHCFSYDPEDAKFIIDELNLYVAFCGNITYKKSNLKNSIYEIPIESMFLETDSPYLSPVPYRGKTNYPYHVKESYKFVSSLKNINLKKLQEQLLENFNNLFNLHK